MAHPLALRLYPDMPLTVDVFAQHLQALTERRSSGGLAPRFGLSSRETRFVRAIHARKSNLWLWRCRQDAFAGDFVVVDMSEPRPEARTVWVLELKQGQALKPVGGHQMSRVDTVLEEIASSTEPFPLGHPYRVLTGDGGAILRHFTQDETLTL